MSIEEALQLLSAANRYILERLKRIVERYLLNFINLDNVAVLFQVPSCFMTTFFTHKQSVIDPL
jgi:hypothetical protein